MRGRITLICGLALDADGMVIKSDSNPFKSIRAHPISIFNNEVFIKVHAQGNRCRILVITFTARYLERHSLHFIPFL